MVTRANSKSEGFFIWPAIVYYVKENYQSYTSPNCLTCVNRERKQLIQFATAVSLFIFELYTHGDPLKMTSLCILCFVFGHCLQLLRIFCFLHIRSSYPWPSSLEKLTSQASVTVVLSTLLSAVGPVVQYFTNKKRCISTSTTWITQILFSIACVKALFASWMTFHDFFHLLNSPLNFKNSRCVRFLSGYTKPSKWYRFYCRIEHGSNRTLFNFLE